MEEASENGKESSHSAHANGMIKRIYVCSDSPEDPQPDWQLSKLYYNIISRKNKGPCLKIVTNYFSKTGANDTYFFIAELCFQASR